MQPLHRAGLFARLCLLCLVTGAALACTPTAAPGAKLRVVATTTPVTALVKVVGGDQIALTGLLRGNSDPHDYEPQSDDLRAVAQAQVICKNGLGLENWLDKLIQNSGTQAAVVDTSRGVRIRTGDAGQTKPLAAGDPHIWHSVPNAIIMLNNIRDALAQADPTHAETYRANAAAYEKKLNELDQVIRAQIAGISPERRKLVTNHDTFGYYAERYGLTIVGSIIPSMDTNYQPSAKELAELVKAIKAQGVPVIFTESSINPNLARQIAQEAGVKVVDGGLYGDTLGPAGSGADTLDGMLKHNTDLIVANLK